MGIRKFNQDLHTTSSQSNKPELQVKGQYKVSRAVILRRRRMTVFAIFALIVLGSMFKVTVHQNKVLAEKVAEKQKIEEELKEVLAEKESLELHVKQLDNDEYIAKLARKEYFLSEEGEILFTLPDPSTKK